MTARDDDLRADLRALAEECRTHWHVVDADDVQDGYMVEQGECVDADELRAVLDAHEPATEPEATRIEDDCGACQKCLVDVPAYPGSGWLTVPMTRMIVCTDCGNKRCPKATDHTLECTGSNEPGQPGSVYGGLR